MNWDSEGRRTVKLDMKGITGFPSAAILHNAKLRKRYLVFSLNNK